eukprot:3417454-Pleurochrysis_carterae.AAC.1
MTHGRDSGARGRGCGAGFDCKCAQQFPSASVRRDIAYERRAAGQVIVCRMDVIIFLSEASTNSGATI